MSDNSGKAKALVRVYGTQYALFANLAMPLRTVGKRGSVQSVSWRVPRAMGAGKFRFCALATDRGGNASKTSCAKLPEEALEQGSGGALAGHAARLVAGLHPRCSHEERLSSHEQRLHPVSADR